MKRPKLSLPTAAGFYESEQFPIDGGEYDPYFCDGDGKWYEVNDTGHSRVTNPNVHAPYFPLGRKCESAGNGE